MSRGLRFMDSLVFTPAPLETILRAEEAISAHLQARWTLQTSGIVRTLHTHTFPGRNFNSHIGTRAKSLLISKKYVLKK